MSKRPNILLVMTDQQRMDSLGCYGSELSQTPVVDRLAVRGVRFDQAYTPCTVCSPARASLLSGLYPHQHGVTGNGAVYNRSLPNLAAALLAAGYRLGYSGKWHIDNTFGPTAFGFEGNDWLGYSYPAGGVYTRFLAGTCLYPVNHYIEYLRENGLETPQLEEAIYRPSNPNMEIHGRQTGPVEASFEHYVAEESIALIDRFAARGTDDKPFFMWTNFWGPHDPYVLPEPWFSLFGPEQVTLSASMRETFDNKPWQQRMMCTNYWGSDRLDDLTWRTVVAKYAAYCAFIDWEVGRLVDRLRHHSLLDNTIIVFVSDHGSMIGHHRLIDKGPYAYDDIQRIPLVMAGPGISTGRVNDELVYLHDLTPTILDWTGAGPFPCSNAQSLVPALAGDELAQDRHDVYMTRHAHPYPYEQRFLRTKRFKYAFNACDIDELYDLERDPDEMTNRIDDPELAPVCREMKERLHAHMRAQQDPLVQCFQVWSGLQTSFSGMPGNSR